MYVFKSTANTIIAPSAMRKYSASTPPITSPLSIERMRSVPTTAPKIEPTSVLPQAAEDAGMEGLPNGGFDVNPRIMENINAGLTTATMDQQPFLQGYLPVMFVALNQRFGIQPSSLNTGVGIVDKTNADLATAYAGTYR